MKRIISVKRLSGFVFTAALSVLVLPSAEIGELSLSGSEAYAQKEVPSVKLDGCKTPPKRRRLKTLTQKFFKKVAEVDALTNPEEKKGVTPEPNFKAAWPKIKKLVDRCDDCNKYEWAQLYQRAAVIRYNLDDEVGAIKYFKKVVEQAPDIPVALESQRLYQIAQLATGQEKYKDSLAQFKKWEALCPAVVKQVSRAIDYVSSKGGKVKENWYKLKLGIYYDFEDYKSAEKVAEIIAVKFTSATNISTVASLYGMNGKEKRQLALLDALYQAKALDSKSAYTNLAFLYLDVDVPILAHKVMASGVKAKKVPRTSKNLEAWGQALTLARENTKAMAIMEEAASKADSGKIYANLAAVYLNSDEYKKCVDAGKKAIKKGVKKPGSVHLYMGSAYMYMKQYNNSLKSLRKALKDKKTEKHAGQMIDYVKKEQKREKALVEAKKNT